MSIYTPTWPKIINPLTTTTTEFGGEWGNLISDYMNGINIGLLDPTKKPKIGTPTTWKFETLGLLDNDESHKVTFSVDDIDTGVDRLIKIRRMNSPNTTDYMVMENMPQIMVSKTMDADLNFFSNIDNADIKAAAAINYSKLNLTNSIVAGDITSNAITTIKILDANVTLAKMASNSVDSSKIVDDSIVNADINSSAAIGWTKISKSGSVLSDIADTSLPSLAQYDLIMRNGSSQWAKLTKGSNSTALTTDASGVVAYTTITNAMLAGSIAYAKLTLNNSIVNADIASGAAIVTSKLADNSNFLLKTQDNSFGAHYFDMTRMTAPGNPAANDGRFYVKQIDSNNDGFFCKIKKGGSFVELQIL